MTLQFTKMHGLGNDFIVIDNISQTQKLSINDIRKLANRHTGIGFDQCLIVEASNTDNIDFFYRIFNANGEEVGQCGNGARCLALFLHHKHLTTKKHITIATKTTQFSLSINPDNSVTVALPPPKFAPDDIPMCIKTRPQPYQLKLISNDLIDVYAANVGNPHAVIIVKDVTTALVDKLGYLVCNDEHFPEKANVGFMQLVNKQHIKLRVYERGAGETLACGSGAVAAAAIAHHFLNASSKIEVMLPGGTLTIDWPQKNGCIYMTGGANFVFDGTLLI